MNLIVRLFVSQMNCRLQSEQLYVILLVYISIICAVSMDHATFPLSANDTIKPFILVDIGCLEKPKYRMQNGNL